MDFGSALGFAWRFARSRERVSLYFLFFLAALVAAGLLVLLLVALAGGALGSAGLQNLLRSPGSAFALVGGAILLLLLLVVLFFVFMGVWLWISAAIMKSAASEYSGERRSLRECLDFAKTRFWPLVVTIILIAIVSFIVELPFSLLQLVPLVGLFFLLVGVLVRIILTLCFFFAQYAAVVAEDGPVEALRKSAGIFLKKPIEVFLTFVLLVVAVVLLLIVFLIPSGALALLALLVVGAVKGAVGLVVGVVIGLAAFLVFLVGVAFLEVFLEGFVTAAFLELGRASAPPSVLSSARVPRVAAKRVPAPRKRIVPPKKRK